MWACGILVYLMVTGDYPFNTNEMGLLEVLDRVSAVEYEACVNDYTLLVPVLLCVESTRLTLEQARRHEFLESYKGHVSLSSSDEMTDCSNMTDATATTTTATTTTTTTTAAATGATSAPPSVTFASSTKTEHKSHQNLRGLRKQSAQQARSNGKSLTHARRVKSLHSLNEAELSAQTTMMNPSPEGWFVPLSLPPFFVDGINNGGTSDGNTDVDDELDEATDYDSAMIGVGFANEKVLPDDSANARTGCCTIL
jgi:hypothetical protein